MGWIAVALLFRSAEVAGTDRGVDAFFADSGLVELTIEADFDALAHDMDRDPPVTKPGVMTVVGTDGATRALDVSLTTRGVSRLKLGICSFPQFFVHIKGDGSEDTVFSGQGMLPLATHCKSPDHYDQYVLQEYLVYRTLSVLTDLSVRSRLARVTYVDTNREMKTRTRYAFFLEHFDHMADRLGRKVVAIEDFHPPDADHDATALMNVFQYMIGNTDWSLPAQHNVVLLRSSDGVISPVPFDFDWTGIVNPTYAYPAAEVDIKNIRQRIYRGACLPEESVIRAFDRLREKRDSIYSLYEEQQGLASRVRKKSLRYYDSFFEVIEDERRRQRKILEACLDYGRD